MRDAYRNWLLAEAKREVHADCARLLAVPDEITVLFGEAMNEWSASRQLALMRGAITTLCRQPGTPAPPEGEETLPLCLFWRQSSRLSELRKRAFKVNKRSLRRAVAKRLTPLFGSPPLAIGGLVRHVTYFSDVTVFTDIDFSPRAPAKLAYEQIIVLGAAEPGVGYFDKGVLLTNMTLFNLLGSTSTRWSFITDDDVPRVGDLLATLCSRWIDAVPDIVEAARAT